MRPRDEERIRAEEKLRAKIQSEIMGRKKSLNLWTFINSAFGIWVLSTLVIGVVSWSYGRWQELRDNAMEIYKLDIEIDARLSGVSNKLFGRLATDDRPLDPVPLLLLPPGPDRAIQREYANRNLKSLLYDLRGRLPYEEQYILIDALQEVKNLESAPSREMTVSELVAFDERVNKIRNLRWGWGMTERDYDTYSKPKLIAFPRWFPTRLLAKLIAILIIIVALFLGYRLFRTMRRHA